MPVNPFKILVVLALSFCSFAYGHHAMEVHYLTDEESVVTYQGVVKKFSLMDPHSYLVVSVEQEGETIDWILEGQSRVLLTRAGWRFDLLAQGASIKFAAFPSRSGDTAGRIVYLEVDGELYCSDACDLFDIELPEEVTNHSLDEATHRLAGSF